MSYEPAVKLERRYLYVVQDVDRHGNVRVYLRYPGAPKLRLKVPLGTPAGDAAYDAALQAAKAAAVGEPMKAADAEKPGTWRWLCHQHFHAAAWKQLNVSSQTSWRRILESTWAEPLEPGSKHLFGDCPIARFEPKHVRTLIERKSDFPHAANDRLKVIKRVFRWAVKNELAATNPARDAERLKTPPGGHHSITDDEIALYRERHAIGTKARLAFELALWTGLRREDLTRIGRQHVRNGWLEMTLGKNEGRNPVSIAIPISEELQSVIDQSPTGEMTFLLTEYGKSFAVAGFGNWFRDRFNEAGLTKCSAHGLRKACARTWAENNASANELMSWFGWLSMKEAAHYTRAANRKKIAAGMMQRRGGKDGT